MLKSLEGTYINLFVHTHIFTYTCCNLSIWETPKVLMTRQAGRMDAIGLLIAFYYSVLYLCFFRLYGLHTAAVMRALVVLYQVMVTAFLVQQNFLNIIEIDVFLTAAIGTFSQCFCVSKQPLGNNTDDIPFAGRQKLQTWPFSRNRSWHSQVPLNSVYMLKTHEISTACNLHHPIFQI